MAKVGGIALILARTGYTGEDGFELIVPVDFAAELFDLLLERGEEYDLALCGLGARDSLRLEAGYPLYGHELSLELTPVEAGLMRFVKLEKPGGFLGRDALAARVEQGPEYMRIGLIAQARRVPREQAELSLGGMRVGWVSSGAFSPILNKPIAQGFVRPEAAQPGMKLEYWVKDNPESCLVHTFPLHQP
jgi:aminomethyltransferase